MSVSEFLARFAKSPVAVASALIFAVMCFAATLAPLLSSQNPYDLAAISILDSRLPPGELSAEGWVFLLGTDDQGRDVLSAILYGLRISIGVSLISGAIALVLGCFVGIIAAYVGGRTDAVIMRVVDLQLAFPAILTALILLAVLGSGLDKIVIALVAVQWAYYARTVRSAALVEREREYVESARCLNLGRWRIMFGHILPNCIAPVIVVATVEVANAIALEATLSFLGVGVPVTEPSLGLLIANGYGFMLSGQYWLSIYPGIVLLFLILSVNLIGDQMRKVLDPRHVS